MNNYEIILKKLDALELENERLKKQIDNLNQIIEQLKKQIK